MIRDAEPDTADHLVSERLGLDRTDARCLSLLVSRGEMSTSELAALSLVRPAAMTFVIDRLERTGQVRRERSSEDRRRVILRVDPETGASLTGLWKERANEGKRHLASYPPEQQRVLLEFVVTQTELQSRHNEGLTAPRESSPANLNRPGPIVFRFARGRGLPQPDVPGGGGRGDGEVRAPVAVEVTCDGSPVRHPRKRPPN